MSEKSTLDVNGKKVAVSNLDKIFYPKTGFTKGNVIDYYVRISPVLLPHLNKRPISLKRYPDGVAGFYFYEKQCPSHRPAWMKTATVLKSEGGEIDYCMLNDLPALVWAANIADLELHTFLHKAPAIHRPTVLAFDLDPGAPANIITCCHVALMLRGLFESFGLETFPKTSGSKGLQIYVPLNSPVTYEKTKAFAHAVAERLESERPDMVVSRMSRNLRKGKVFVDWSQNDEKKTTVCAYSLRAQDRPAVSTPVTWKEIEGAATKRKVLSFESADVLRRVEKHGDLFESVLTRSQKLPPAERLATAAL